MDVVVSVFMEPNSMMKISKLNIKEEVIYQWLTPVKIPMDLNSS